jgi:AcrR family transcriptional regulator
MGIIAMPERDTAASATGSAKSDTLRRILAAARVEFARSGLAGARVEDIAGAAGVTKQLVYHYYKDKVALFGCVLDDMSMRIMSELIDRNYDDLPPPEAVRAFVHGIIDQYAGDPLLGPLAGEGIRFHNDHMAPESGFPKLAPALLSRFERILSRGVEATDFRAGLDPRSVLGLIVLICTGAFTNRYSLSVILGRDSTSVEGVELWRRDAADFVLAALRPNRR